MHISDKTFLAMVEMHGSISPENLKALQVEGESSRQPLQTLAIKKRLISDKQLTRLFSEYANIPYIEIDPKEISIDAVNILPEYIARQYNSIVFRIDETGLVHLAMEDPDDVEALSFIQKREEDVSEDSPIAKTVNLLLEYAVRSGASDIHIEPRENYIQLRYRIDGILKETNQLPKNIANALVSRVKILANLKIDERRVPQDGRIKIRLGGRKFAFRVSTLPITDGEKVVMRVLNESSEALPLEKLGYWGKSLDTINNALTEPNGMVLVTGPTGSGKSTSLFSVLSKLNTPDVNISTIEDPVEYKIPGVNQTQTNNKAGMTFASGLRALLRQDPNIIMVGEIRDSETANLGVQAALTGHLVFSTLHTNNAATTLPRLLDMGIEPFLIASTAKAVVGQRLVRRLRHETRIKYIPTEEEKQTMIRLFNLRPGQTFAYIHELEKQAAAAGIGGDSPLATDENGINFLWKQNENDNDDGAHGGFKGRIGIYEVLGMSNELQRLITANATANEIQNQAIEEGMITMQTDGLIKALRGDTTLGEVMRATKE